MIELSGPCLIVSSGKRNGIILLLSSSINAHTYISLYLLGANVTSLNEFPIYSHCFSAFLVLNTVIKMQKNKFFLNFYTNGRNTNLINPLVIKTFTYSQSITLAPNGGQEIRIPITVPDGYMFLCVTNVKSNGNVAYACYIASSSNVLTCFVGNDRNEQKIIPQGISADALFVKKWW